MVNTNLEKKKVMKQISCSIIVDPMNVPNPQFKVEPAIQHISKESLTKPDKDLMNSLFEQNPVYNKTMSTLKEFSDYRLKMAMKQVIVEKKLSKVLDRKIHQNLESLATSEKYLKEQQSFLQKKLFESTKNLIVSEKFSTIGELTSKFSHDVKNPLNLIQTQLNLLQLKLVNDGDDHSKVAFLRIFRALTGINGMIEQVLNYVHVNPLQIKKIQLLDILKTSILECVIPETIKISLPKEDCTVLCDDYQIGIIFNNLIINSIQAMNSNGEIKIKISENSRYAIIEFQDSGPGIPPKTITEIFEPLFTTKQTGTGLGLASCKSIIEKHGGTISMKNNPTTFTITLPKNLNVSEML